MSPAKVLLLAGCAALTAVSHALLQLADRRSRSQYEAMLRSLGQETIDAVWFGGRPLVGLWGCGLVVFQFLRGLGVVAFVLVLLVALVGG